MTVIAFSKAVGPVQLDVFVSEKHESALEITLNPVEFGADITDHAYSQPKKVMLDVADSSAALTYQALVRFQESRIPFTLVTGLDIYRNMLIARLEADRDREFSNVLRCKVDLQEVIIVSSAHVVGRGETSLSPEKAGDGATADRVAGTVQRGDIKGPASNTPAGGARAASELQSYTPQEKSILKQVVG
jgi:hypothetical protein